MLDLKAASQHKRHVGWIRGQALKALIHLYGQIHAACSFLDQTWFCFWVWVWRRGQGGGFIFSSKIEVPQPPPKKGFPGQNDNKSLPCQLLLTTLSYFGFCHHSVSVAWQSNDKHCGGRMGLPASLVSTMVLTGLHPSPRSAYHLEPLPPSLSLTWVGAWAHF